MEQLFRGERSAGSPQYAQACHTCDNMSSERSKCPMLLQTKKEERRIGEEGEEEDGEEKKKGKWRGEKKGGPHGRQRTSE